MANIKDIAKAAGVSATTVSNVLNKRGNVSSKKILLVEQAAARMGYRLNENASALRSGQVKDIAVVLPDIKTGAYADLYEGVAKVAKQAGYSVSLYVTSNVPEEERRIISEVASSRASCVLAVSSLKEPLPRYEALIHAGVYVLFAERVSLEDESFLGFDMGEAAKSIAERVVEDGCRRVGLMTNMLTYPNEERFANTFSEALKSFRSDISLSTVATVSSQYLKRAFSLTQGDTLPDAIVTTCEEMALSTLSALSVCPSEPTPKIYTLAPARLLASGGYTRYALDYRQLGEKLAKRLIDKEKPSRVVLKAQGFRPVNAPNACAKESEQITLLTLESPYTEALRRLLPHLKRTKGIDVRLVTFPSANMKGIIGSLGNSAHYDLVRMDMAQLSWLGEKTLCPLSELPTDIQALRARLLPELTGEYTDVSNTAYALPLDPTVQLLFYRQDLFEDAANCRTYYELHKRPLEVPKTYEEFARVAQFFDQRFRAESKTAYGCVLTHLAQEHISMLLAQTEQHRFGGFCAKSLEHLFKVRAEMEKASAPGTAAWWAASIEAFAQGKCAMCLVYANYAERLSNNPLSRISGRVGFAKAPGVAMLGGGVIGVVKASKKKQAATRFLEWLYSDQISRLLALLSGASPCFSAYEDTEILDNYPWLTAIREGFLTGVRRAVFPNVKMPFDQIALEETIGELALSAVRGALSPQEALEQMAQTLKSCQK